MKMNVSATHATNTPIATTHQEVTVAVVNQATKATVPLKIVLSALVK